MHCFKTFLIMKKHTFLFSMFCVLGLVERSDSSYHYKISDHNQNYGAHTIQSNSHRQRVNVFSQDTPHHNYYNNIAEDLYKIFNIILNYGSGNKFGPIPGLNQYNVYNNNIPKKNLKGQRFVHYENVPIRQHKKYSQLQNIQHFDSNNIKNSEDASTTTEPTIVLGKPVLVPIDGLDEMTFNKSSEEATRKQCVQDCQSSSSYNPVCGSNNVTFFNEEKFLCARNCGIDIYVTKQGECN